MERGRFFRLDTTNSPVSDSASMKLYPRSLFLALALLTAPRLQASLLQIHLAQYGSDGYHQYFPTDDGTSTGFSSAIAGSYSSGSGSVGYGYADLHATARSNGTTGGSFQTTASWSDDYVITPTDSALVGTAGSAIFSYHLTGSDTVIHSGSTSAGAHYDYTFNGTGQAYELDNGSGFPKPISNFATTTFTVPFTFGSLFTVSTDIGAAASPAGATNPEASVDIRLQLHSAGMTVTGAGGTAVNYTTSSHSGAAKGVLVPSDGSYNGITLTNTTGRATQMKLLGGFPTVDTTVQAAFAPAAPGDALVSDVLSFSGTGTSKFVLQLGYNVADAVSLFGSESNAVLLWLNPATGLYVNSILGNSDGGTTNQQFFSAYDPTKFVLGNYGVDTVTHTVWAVIDHNSSFAVGAVPAPEPATWVLLLIAVGGGFFQVRPLLRKL